MGDRRYGHCAVLAVLARAGADAHPDEVCRLASELVGEQDKARALEQGQAGATVSVVGVPGYFRPAKVR